jgi:hypothetical protein
VNFCNAIELWCSKRAQVLSFKVVHFCGAHNVKEPTEETKGLVDELRGVDVGRSRSARQNWRPFPKIVFRERGILDFTQIL